VGVVTRPDSPFYWLNLERPGQRPIRESTMIPVAAPTPELLKEHRRLADALYAVKMADLVRGRHNLHVDKPKTTFKAYRAWYLENISVHKRNIVRETSMFRQLAPHFDPLSLDQFTLDLGREWRTKRSREVAPGTVNRELILLKHMLSTAVPKYLTVNPLAGLSQLRVPERDPRVLEPDEEVRLLAVLDAQDRALVLCALDTLQRLSSVAGLKRAQDHGTYLTFLNTKTKGGKVPVSARLRVTLDAVTADGPWFFPRYQGGSDSARQGAIGRMFTEACTAAKIQAGRAAGGLTFHCLRHTGASRMLERGADIETVRRIGGWANLKVLQRYLHPSDAAGQRAVDAIGGA
jgi:integrase